MILLLLMTMLSSTKEKTLPFNFLLQWIVNINAVAFANHELVVVLLQLCPPRQ